MPCLQKNEAGNVLSRRIAVDQVKRFPGLFQHGNEGIGLAQDHFVIEIFLNPCAQVAFDITKIDEHAPRVQTLTFKDYNGFRIVTMQEAALPVVVEESMAVTELNFLRDAEHERIL